MFVCVCVFICFGGMLSVIVCVFVRMSCFCVFVCVFLKMFEGNVSVIMFVCL